MGRPLNTLLTDLDRLTAPISAERPCGEWLRYEGTYEQIRDARREDDTRLPQGVWQTELKRANWDAVEQLCAEALAGRSKDLQIAAWLLAAWIQLDSFAGAARGIELMRRLCSAYWEKMFPALDADLASRLAPIQWVNDKLTRRLRLLRLTQPAMEGIAAYSLAEWDIALRNPGSAGEGVNMAKFEQSVALTDHRWFVALNEDVLKTIEQVRAFDALIDEKAGKLAPGLIKFRTEASAAAQLLETMLAATRGSDPEPAQLSATGSATEAVGDEDEILPAALDIDSPRAQPRVRSRAEAYDLLEEIAVFLYRNDPHSPTPYLIWRAVGWRDMHFNELLPELVRDNVELSDLVKLLRLDAPPNGNH